MCGQKARQREEGCNEGDLVLYVPPYGTHLKPMQFTFAYSCLQAWQSVLKQAR